MLLWILLLLTATSGVVITAHSDPGFLSVGDWGSAALGGYHQRNAMATAAAMKAIAQDSDNHGTAFVLNTGDNFYYCGIRNTSDPQITEDYTNVFGGMGVPWYNSLGNHDYGFSPEAQLSLNETIPGWIMDARYYHRRVVIPDDGIVANIIVLDTNPCIKDYRGSDRRKWDPCGTQYPDCSPIDEPCRFNENILSQDCDAQLEWAKGVLASIPANRTEWVFIVGHHKADEINVADFQTTFLDDPRVHLYLNGHTHNLEHYAVNGQAKYITTGAGGMVLIGEEEEAAAVGGQHGQQSTATNGNVKSIWSKVITGFTSHIFTNNGTTLITNFWDTKSLQIPLYQFNVYLDNHIQY